MDLKSLISKGIDSNIDLLSLIEIIVDFKNEGGTQSAVVEILNTLRDEYISLKL